MPEQLREQLETAIDLRLRKGAQRHDFGSFLFPTSLLQEWYERAGIRGVYEDIALEDKVCLEVIHQKKSETKIPIWNKTILSCPEFKSIRLGVLPDASDFDRSYRYAHQLILYPGQAPLLVNIDKVGRYLRHQNHSAAREIDLGYFLQFVQESKAFAPGSLRLIR